MEKLTSREQRLSGLTNFKLKLLDTLIEQSIKKGGKLTTKDLVDLRKGLESFAKKMEIVETLEETK
jgi:hypothetical protein